MLVDTLVIRAGCCGSLRERELMPGLGKRLCGRSRSIPLDGEGHFIPRNSLCKDWKALKLFRGPGGVGGWRGVLGQLSGC